MNNVNDKEVSKKYQPICLICHPEICDVVGCDKRTKFLDWKMQDEEAARLRAELKSFMEVKA
jgi:hypothetical protein